MKLSILIDSKENLYLSRYVFLYKITHKEIILKNQNSIFQKYKFFTNLVKFLENQLSNSKVKLGNQFQHV